MSPDPDIHPHAGGGTNPCAPSQGEPRPFRLQVLSDLLFETSPLSFPRLAEGVDAVVVAGDTCEGAEKAFAYLRAAFPPPVPVLAVLGNRAFHGRVLSEEMARARQLAIAYGIDLLEDRTASVGPVRFVGSTMWTGYDLHGEARQPGAMAVAALGMADHRRIGLVPGVPRHPFTPYDALRWYQASTARMLAALGEAWDGPTVVVTHHAPSLLSLDGGMAGSPLAPAHASRLDAMVRGSGAALWVHGHIPSSCDYRIGDTRVLCNPRGPAGANPGYDPALVVELPHR